MAQTSQVCTYDPASSVVFLKTKERFGGLSNMAPGFPLNVNGIRIRTSEALYQACRFPNRQDVQRRIIEERSPMTAKMRSKAFRKESRSDWDAVRVKIMRWCLRVKLAQNWRAFSDLLLKTADRPIVEQSRKDDFWGAKPIDERTLVGRNVLGRLLMELTEAVKAEGRDSLLLVQPLAIPDFMLGGRPIGIVTGEDEKMAVSMAHTAPITPHSDVDSLAVLQQSLFTTTVVHDTTPPTHPASEKNSVRIIDLTPYPDYKESGLPWLGEVPTHWPLIPNRAMLRRRKILVGERYTDYELLSLTKAGVIVRDVSTGRGKFSADMGTSQEVRCGDLVFCLFDVPETPRTVGLSQHKGMITSAYNVFECNDQVLACYLEAFYIAMDDRKLLSPLYSGLRNTIPASRFLGVKTPVPPPVEQTAIVRFLDYADRRIRRYIRAKQKLIALLEEQKQAIIHQAVTGQIDVRTGQPYPAYKPSGVEWLGEVPVHWKVRRTKALFRLRTEKSGVAHGRELLSIYTSIGVRPRKDLEEKGNKASTTDEYWIVKRGDLIANKLLAWMGAIGVSHYDGVTSPAYDILMPVVDLVTDYYHHLFRTHLYLQQFKQRSRGIMDMRLRLYFDQFGQIPIPVPPVNEQQAIVNFYNDAMVDIDRTIYQTRRQIDLLREYRTRLIADAVTGKFDVREAAAALPEVDPLAADYELDESLDEDAEEAIEELDPTAEVVQA